MLNKKLYSWGRRKEYYIAHKLKKQNFDIVQRTSASHSPFDIIAIDKKNKKIKLVQVKRKEGEPLSYVDPELKEKLEEENKDLNGVYEVFFETL